MLSFAYSRIETQKCDSMSNVTLGSGINYIEKPISLYAPARKFF